MFYDGLHLHLQNVGPDTRAICRSGAFILIGIQRDHLTYSCKQYAAGLYGRC
jgi:hypothetical protein